MENNGLNAIAITLQKGLSNIQGELEELNKSVKELKKTIEKLSENKKN